jgi:hypothetical protein
MTTSPRAMEGAHAAFVSDATTDAMSLFFRRIGHFALLSSAEEVQHQ